MIAPGPLLPLVLLLPTVVSLMVLVDPTAWRPILALDAAVATIALWDLATVPRKKRFRVEREIARVCSLGERHNVALLVENRGRRDVRAEIKDDSHVSFESEPESFTVTLPVRRRTRLTYVLIPRERGGFPLEKVYLRAHSRLGLWRRQFHFPSPHSLRVYPDLKQLSRYALYARLNRLSLLGVRKTRRVGTDNEFERLRDYTSDDNYKFIDWRSTARRRKLIVKDFQANHSQRVVFMLDAGRMMVNRAGDSSLLDHALDATIMLAHVALSRGDQVGLLTFSDRIHDWIAPASGGRRQVNRLVHAGHDLFPQLVESRYDDAFLHLARNCRKRALVILVTNLIDDVNGKQVEAHLTNLVGRHLPLAVLLRDHELFDAAAEGEEAEAVPARTYRAAAAADILDWRRRVLGDLRHQGALVLDVFPEQMTAPLINEYLRVKARHLL